MEYKFTILGRLDGLNEYVRACRTNPYKGAKMKKEGEETAIWAIKRELPKVQIEQPVKIHYRFYEPNRRRDFDNISAFAHKVIQDSLVKTGVLKNDSWKEIRGYEDEFYCDKRNPRIEVIIREVEADGGI